MMVVLIAMMCAAMAVPAFMRSYRGARLRASVRSVVSTHRYARSMAVLHQQTMVVLFNTKRNELEVLTVNQPGAEQAVDRFMDGSRAASDGMAASYATNAAADEPGTNRPPPAVKSELIRPLEENVRITRFDTPREKQAIDKLYWINYYPGGMCDPYGLELEDDHGERAQIRVDALSGAATVEME